MEDSLKINFNEDTNEMSIEWDQDDPKWSFLNSFSTEDLESFIIKSLEEKINEFESQSST